MNYHSNFPTISVSLKINNSYSPSLTLVPPNSGSKTLSPTLRESGINFPLLSYAPGPASRITP
jgi:hypothetical protein